jgi:hypothetical protein
MAAAILVCWIAGLAVLASRRRNIPGTDLLAQGALQLEPATYFYVLSQGDRQIGSATSAVDTIASGFNVRETIRLDATDTSDNQPIVASSSAYLTRGFVLDSFAILVAGVQHPLHLRAEAGPGSRVLLPSLAPVAMILSHQPRAGARTSTWLYNPVSRRTERVTLAITAESLFRVVDSAAFDSTRSTWTAAHIDTVRSWKITTPSHGISAWVDSRGRIVAASEAGGATLMRTAYEIAMLNPKLPSH